MEIVGTSVYLTIPPPKEESMATKVKYTKKARHGHGKDVMDIHNIRQVAGCLPIDPISKRCLLISSSKNPNVWVIVNSIVLIRLSIHKLTISLYLAKGWMGKQ
jgi:hypothetical protein